MHSKSHPICYIATLMIVTHLITHTVDTCLYTCVSKRPSKLTHIRGIRQRKYCDLDYICLVKMCSIP